MNYTNVQTKIRCHQVCCWRQGKNEEDEITSLRNNIESEKVDNEYVFSKKFSTNTYTPSRSFSWQLSVSRIASYLTLLCIPFIVSLDTFCLWRIDSSIFWNVRVSTIKNIKGVFLEIKHYVYKHFKHQTKYQCYRSKTMNEINVGRKPTPASKILSPN